MKTLALAAAAIGLAATPAFANPARLPAAKVSAAGLDLASPEGQTMLDQRIERAAKQVCGINDIRTGTRLRSTEARKCYDQAQASARRQVASIMDKQRRGG